MTESNDVTAPSRPRSRPTRSSNAVTSVSSTGHIAAARRAEDDRHRVEEDQRLVAQQRGEQDDEEQHVLDLAPGFRHCRAAPALALEGQEVEHRSQRAQPAAPRPPEDEGQDERDDGEPRPYDEAASGQRAGQCQQRIETDGDVERVAGQPPAPCQHGESEDRDERPRLDALSGAYPADSGVHARPRLPLWRSSTGRRARARSTLHKRGTGGFPA